MNSEKYNATKFKKLITDSLSSGGIILNYQPILNNKTGELGLFEGLIRMKDKDKLYGPDDFLEEARKSGIYEKLTERVVDIAVESIKKYNIKLSINLEYSDIANDKTMNNLYKSLKENSEITKKLTLEITETEKMSDYKKVADFIEHVQSLGVKVYIDDFGTGYSNFEAIAKLNLDGIKIDGSIVRNVNKDKRNYITLKYIMNLAKEFKAETVAEFVEDRDILITLNTMGIDYSQGYYISKPVSEEEIHKWKGNLNERR